MRIPLALLLLCTALTAGCATARRFTPRENVTGWSASGYPAAAYAFAEGAARAEVSVWSDGAELETTCGGERAVLHVGLEVKNLGEGSVAVDLGSVGIQGAMVGERTVEVPPPRQVAGEAAAEPGRTTRVEAWFELGGVRPRELDGFELHWRVLLNGAPIQQITPFQPWIVPAHFLGDPWYGAWGWGYWGYGRC